MTPDDDVPAEDRDADRVGLTGARFRSRSATGAPRPRSPDRFESALRGYARHQVDEHLGRQDRRIRELEDELREAERRRTAAEEHAARLGAELAAASGRPRRAEAEPAQPGSVGDALLRLARREAAGIRAEADRDARRVLAEADAEADRRRAKAEQDASAWAERVERHLARRLAETDARQPPDPAGS